VKSYTKARVRSSGSGTLSGAAPADSLQPLLEKRGFPGMMITHMSPPRQEGSGLKAWTSIWNNLAGE